MLDLVKLKTFLMVATTGSFKGAGVRLCYSQANVSTHIRILEREIGAPLFDRFSTRNVILTDVGRQMMTYAHRLLDLAEEARSAVRRQENVAGPISISAPEVVLSYCLPEVLRQFQESFPEVHVSVAAPQESREQVDQILKGTLDLAIVMDEPIQSDSLTSVCLRSEDLLLVGAPKYRFFPRDFTWEDFAMETVLVTGSDCTFRRLTERILNEARIALPNTIELGTLEAAKRCVMSGMGLAVMPKMAVVQELADNRLVALAWPGSRIPIALQMIRHRERWASRAVHGLWRLAEECLTSGRGASLSTDALAAVEPCQRHHETIDLGAGVV